MQVIAGLAGPETVGKLYTRRRTKIDQSCKRLISKSRSDRAQVLLPHNRANLISDARATDCSLSGPKRGKTMKLRNMITALFLTAGIAFSSTAAAVTIFFNEAEVPGLSSGMPVTNEWASFGIDLSGTYWYIDGRDPFDQRGIANSGLEGIVSFIAGTNSFTVDWLTISGSITIEAFSSADALLDSYTATCAGGAVECSGTETLSGSDIAYFKFRDGGGTVGISTLTFDSVPEPGTLALLGLGLAGLAASRRRNQ